MADDIMKEDIVVVTSPEDTVEAFTKERSKLPAIRFVYHPMSSVQHARYLDNLKSAGEKLSRNQQANYRMLADHVIDGDLYNSKKEKLDFSDAKAWENVIPVIIFDTAATIAGLDVDLQEAEEKEFSDL